LARGVCRVQRTARFCEHGIDGVAGAVSQVIASHVMLGLEMSDHGLDCGAELAFYLRRDATLLAGGVDLELVTGGALWPRYPTSVRARSMVLPTIR
jgi:hypothetical protein